MITTFYKLQQIIYISLESKFYKPIYLLLGRTGYDSLQLPFIELQMVTDFLLIVQINLI